MAILVATVAAFLLVPAAQAAAGTLKVKIAGTGSGTVKNITQYVETSPPIVCPGVCEGTFTGEFVPVAAIPAGGSKFTGWTINSGEGVFLCDGSEEEKEFAEGLSNEEVYGSSYVGATGACFVGEAGGEITANFTKVVTPVPNVKVTIESGSGTIVSNPAGISCSGEAVKSCEAKLAEGPVVLTASPAPGYAFKSWKKCDGGGVNGRQCTIAANATLKEIGASFIKVWNLKATKSGGLGILGSSPGGVNCGYACSSSTAFYKEGSLTVKAKPAKNFHFVEFTGGTGSASSCTGKTAETCTITIAADSSVNEVYAENAKNTLSLTKEGGGQGFVKTKPTNINCGYTCTADAAEFFAAESPEVSVTFGKGTSKVTWVSGAGTCTGNAVTCTVPMSSSHSLVAKFE